MGIDLQCENCFTGTWQIYSPHPCNSWRYYDWMDRSRANGFASNPASNEGNWRRRRRTSSTTAFDCVSRWPTVNLSFWESGSDLLDFGAHCGSRNIPNPQLVRISMNPHSTVCIVMAYRYESQEKILQLLEQGVDSRFRFRFTTCEEAESPHPLNLSESVLQSTITSRVYIYIYNPHFIR